MQRRWYTVRLTIAARGAKFVQTSSRLCFDLPTGRVCQWDIVIFFRRGNATGELHTVAPKPYSLNSTSHAIRLARKVLARWH